MSTSYLDRYKDRPESKIGLHKVNNNSENSKNIKLIPEYPFPNNQTVNPDIIIIPHFHASDRVIHFKNSEKIVALQMSSSRLYPNPNNLPPVFKSQNMLCRSDAPTPPCQETSIRGSGVKLSKNFHNWKQTESAPDMSLFSPGKGNESILNFKEPVSDTALPQVIMLGPSKRTRPDLDITTSSVPILPTPRSNDFPTAWNTIINICNQFCDFSDPTFDVSAKAAKNLALYRLMQFCGIKPQDTQSEQIQNVQKPCTDLPTNRDSKPPISNRDRFIDDKRKAIIFGGRGKINQTGSIVFEKDSLLPSTSSMNSKQRALANRHSDTFDSFINIKLLTQNQITQLIDMCFSHIFRPIPKYPEVLINITDNSGTIIPIMENSYEHIWPCYLIIKRVYQVWSHLDVFSSSYFHNIVYHFQTSDENERKKLIDLFLDYSLVHQTEAELREQINVCLDMISLYLNKKATPFCLKPINIALRLIYHPDIDDTFSTCFLSHYLPIVTAQHFCECSDEVIALVHSFMKYRQHQPLAFPSLKYLLRHMTVTNSIKKASLLILGINFMEHLSASEFKEIHNPIIHTYGKAIASFHLKIGKAGFLFLRNINIEPFLIDNSSTCFPIIFDYIWERKLQEEKDREAEKPRNKKKYDIIDYLDGNYSARDQFSAQNIYTNVISILFRIDSNVTNELVKKSTAKGWRNSSFVPTPSFSQYTQSNTFNSSQQKPKPIPQNPYACGRGSLHLPSEEKNEICDEKSNINRELIIWGKIIRAAYRADPSFPVTQKMSEMQRIFV